MPILEIVLNKVFQSTRSELPEVKLTDIRPFPKAGQRNKTRKSKVKKCIKFTNAQEKIFFNTQKTIIQFQKVSLSAPISPS